VKRTMSGFTLVELLVVITILAILGGLIMMGAGNAQQGASRADAVRTISGLYMAFEAYKAEKGDYPMTIPTADITDGDGSTTDTTHTFAYNVYDSATYSSSSNSWTFKKSSTTVDTTPLMILEYMKLFSFDHENLDSSGYLTDRWGNRYMIKKDSSPPDNWPTLDFYIYSTGGASKTEEFIYKK